MPSLLATGAGAAQGLDDYLQKMLIQARMQQLQGNEQTRLGLESRQLDQLDQERRDRLALTAGTARETAAERGIKSLAPNTSIEGPAFTKQFAGTTQESNFSPERTLPSTQMSGASELGETAPTLSPLKMRSAPEPTGRMTYAGTPEYQKSAQDEAKLEEIANAPDTTPAVRGFLRIRAAMPKGENIPYQLITEPNGPVRADPTATHQANRNYDIAHPLPEHTAPQFLFDAAGKTHAYRFNGDKVEEIPLPEGTSKPNPVDVKQVGMKKTGLEAVTRVESDIDAAAAAGLIGPAAGRFYTALAKVGTTGDPAKDHLIGRLKSDLLLTKMHVDAGIGGTRAAASPLLLKNWEELAMSSSPALLKGYTSAIRDDMGTGAPTSTGPKIIRYGLDEKVIP